MLLSRSRASGNLPLAKKMIKRLCKFRARHPQFVYLLFLEWGNPVNVSLFQKWLQGLKPGYRKDLLGKARTVTNLANESILSDNLEKWALHQ